MELPHINASLYKTTENITPNIWAFIVTLLHFGDVEKCTFWPFLFEIFLILEHLTVVQHQILAGTFLWRGLIDVAQKPWSLIMFFGGFLHMTIGHIVFFPLVVVLICKRSHDCIVEVHQVYVSFDWLNGIKSTFYWNCQKSHQNCTSSI